MYAEEGSQEDYSEDDEEAEIRDKTTHGQYYNPDFLERKTKFDLGRMEEHYKDVVQDEEEGDYEDEEDLEEIDSKQKLLPSVNDPRLWMVRVKKNCERQAAMCLMNKAIDFAKKNHPL